MNDKNADPIAENNARTTTQLIKVVEQRDGPNIALFEAVRWSHVQEVKRLIAAGVDVEFRHPHNCITPLMVCSSRDIAKLLIASGADVNAIDALGRTPLLAFLLVRNTKRKATSYCRSLIGMGANPNLGSFRDTDTLSWAASKHGEDFRNLLLAEYDHHQAADE